MSEDKRTAKGTQILRVLKAGSVSQKAKMQGGLLLLPLDNKMCLSLGERKKGKKMDDQRGDFETQKVMWRDL